METAFNLHRRSLFVDSGWECLLARSFPLFSAFLRARAALSARPQPARQQQLAVLSFHPPFKRALSFIYRFDRIFYSDCTTLAQNGESLYDCQSPTIVTGWQGLRKGGTGRARLINDPAILPRRLPLLFRLFAFQGRNDVRFYSPSFLFFLLFFLLSLCVEEEEWKSPSYFQPSNGWKMGRRNENSWPRVHRRVHTRSSRVLINKIDQRSMSVRTGSDM